MRDAARYSLRVLVLLGPLGLAACGGHSGIPTAYSPGEPYPGIDCAPFARELSGIALYGDAASWWDQAAGRYRRGSQPILGAALVFRREDRLPSGHVSVVSRLLGPRQIQVTQANWVHGELNKDQLVVDISENNDWSTVRVWWPPVGQLGAHEYATYGFILPANPATHDELANAASLAAQLALSSNFGRPPPRARELSRSAM